MDERADSKILRRRNEEHVSIFKARAGMGAVIMEGQEIGAVVRYIEALERQAARRTTPDREAWISVDERWPDDDAVVLVALWAYGRPDGERIILIARRYGAAFFDEQTGDDVYLPTHWMPLPTAPTSDQGEKS